MLFALLVAAVASGIAATLDAWVRTAVHAGASDFASGLAFGLSRLGSIAVLLFSSGLAVVALWLMGRRRSALTLSWFMAGAVGLEIGLKHLFHRARPEVFFGPALETFSFPSGHALLSFCFYCAIAVLLTGETQSHAARLSIWTAAMLLVLGIGLARIYLGVHYPTDVLGGYLAGAFWFSVFWRFGSMQLESRISPPIRRYNRLV